MGQSKSIADLKTQGDEAKKFLSGLADDAQKEADFGKGELDKLKTQKYGANPDDSVSMFYSNRADSTVMSEWSLDNVKKIVDATSAALFGKPPAVSTDAPAIAIPAGVAGMANLELYIASQALSLISGILDAFTSTSAGKTLRKGDYRDIAPGITLFTWVSEMTYESSQFFTNDFVSQNVYVFEAKFSAKEALAYSKTLDAGLYEDQKAAFRTRMEAIVKKIADPTTADDAVVKLMATSDAFQAFLDAITVKIAALDAAHKNAIAADVAKVRMLRFAK